MDRETWRATVQKGHKELDMTQQLSKHPSKANETKAKINETT